MLAEVMSLDEKHDGGIEFLMAIHDFNEISRVLLRKDLNHGIEMNRECVITGCAYRQDILECWLEEVSELLLGDEFEEGGFERVTA